MPVDDTRLAAAVDRVRTLRDSTLKAMMAMAERALHASYK
jgi:hypothetical protein